jgi:hypothetical protein
MFAGGTPRFPKNSMVPVGAIVVLAPETRAVKVTLDPVATLRDEAWSDRFGGGNLTSRVVAGDSEPR